MYRWKFTLPLGLRFRFDEIVTEWAEPERLAYRAVSGWDMEASALFEPDGSGTRETFTLRYRAPSPWNWLMPAWLIAWDIRSALVKIDKSVAREKRS